MTAATPELQVLDVSKLPMHAVGARTPLWWATVLLIAIEATTFAIMLTAYFYVRNGFEEWPPSERLRLLPGAVSAGLLSATLVPTWLYWRAACRDQFQPMRVWVVIATALSLLTVVARFWELHEVPFLWTGNAYTSVVWTTFGLHTFDFLAGVFENIFLCAVLFRRRVELKTFTDVECGALFWFFTVLVWLPFAGIFYFDGVLP